MEMIDYTATFQIQRRGLKQTLQYGNDIFKKLSLTNILKFKIDFIVWKLTYYFFTFITSIGLKQTLQYGNARAIVKRSNDFKV